jgi:hypothetical protein
MCPVTTSENILFFSLNIPPSTGSGRANWQLQKQTTGSINSKERGHIPIWGIHGDESKTKIVEIVFKSGLVVMGV